MMEGQEQVLEALRVAAAEATAAGTLADMFTEVERANTGTLIAAARPRSSSMPCRLADDGDEPLTEGAEHARKAARAADPKGDRRGLLGDIPAVWGGVLNPEHAKKAPFSFGNGDAVSAGCPFWRALNGCWPAKVRHYQRREDRCLASKAPKSPARTYGSIAADRVSSRLLIGGQPTVAICCLMVQPVTKRRTSLTASCPLVRPKPLWQRFRL
jgi:hypothetical protein